MPMLEYYTHDDILRDEQGKAFECEVWLDNEDEPCPMLAVERMVYDEDYVRVCERHGRILENTRGRVVTDK